MNHCGDDELDRRPGISIQNLWFSYSHRNQSVEVFKGLDCDFHRNEITVVLGRSGCGKSTLLKIICGVMEPTTSTAPEGPPPITIAGYVPNLARARRLLGYLPQDCQPAPWRTVRGNIELALEMAGVEKRQRAISSDEAIARLGLESISNRYPHQLSGGQKRRVAIGTVLAVGPAYILLDEPFHGLDDITKREAYRFLLDVWRNRPGNGDESAPRTATGQGLIIVTHDLFEAALLADRILVIQERPVRAMHVIVNETSRISIERHLGGESVEEPVREAVEHLRRLL